MKKSFLPIIFLLFSTVFACNKVMPRATTTAPSQKQIKNSLRNKHPKNIILLIGDGMGLAQSYAAFTAQKGNLSLYEFPVTGFSKTWSADKYITDSAAGGTAIACGVKTLNGAIGVDPQGNCCKINPGIC